MKRHTALITGPSGFIGTHLTRRLLAKGFIVKVITRDKAAIAFGPNETADLEVVQGSYADPLILKSVLPGVDFIYHLASSTQPRSSNDSPVFDIATNLEGTLSLLEELRSYPNIKLIFASSGGTVYGNALTSPIDESHPTDPICSYGIVKLAIEKYIAMYYIENPSNYQILRIANPYGLASRLNPQQGLIVNLIDKVSKGSGVEIWGDGSVVRDYIFMDDLIDALYLAAVKSPAHRILNIGTGTGHSINDVISVISRVMNSAPVLSYLDKRSFDVPLNVLSPARAKAELGWVPQYTLTDGVSKMLQGMAR
jgi:UDP-glucose 4-epimerase